MTRLIPVLLILATVAFAECGEDAVLAEPEILSRIISGAERSGEPLCSKKGEQTVYYLRSAEYVGECSAPFGAVHIARLFFIRSGIRGQATPPPRGHTFIVFLDREFAVRGRWDVDITLGHLVVSGSKVLLDDKALFDFEHPPATGNVIVDGAVQSIPQWK